jgi:hypothetical protein
MAKLLTLVIVVCTQATAGIIDSTNISSAFFPQPSRLPLASQETQTFVRMAISDRFLARDIPDIGLLGTAKRIAVREDMPGAGHRLNHDALPTQEGYEFFLLSQAAAEARAAESGKPVHFITVDRAVISVGVAKVSLGVDVVLPPNLNLVKLCCCAGEAQFRRVGDRWLFVKWDAMVCA